jgi:hypothetical protein
MFRLLYKAIFRLQLKRRFIYTTGNVFKIRDLVYTGV